MCHDYQNKLLHSLDGFYSHLNSNYMLNGEIALTINPRSNSNNLPNFHR